MQPQKGLDIMILKGDTEKQAALRDDMIKKSRTRRSRYVSSILSVLKPRMNLLDIGCGTAHIIQELALNRKDLELVGLDVSKAMLKISKKNCEIFNNVELIMGDGLNLPFADQAFSIIITRLALYSLKDAYRVLKKRGIFLEFGLGPEADKEILEFFPERIETENFFFPKDLKEWKQEVSEPIERAGFIILDVREYKEIDFYESEDELMDLIEMVPLVKDFDRERDRTLVKNLAEKYKDADGMIRITWHYCIIMAARS
jgi:SAM-dependent methyltransferase